MSDLSQSSSPAAPDPRRDALLIAIAGAVVETVAAAGPDGAPSGTLYAAFTAAGCTHSQFEQIMEAMVKVGALRRSGQLYFVTTYPTREAAARAEQALTLAPGVPS